MEIINKDRIKKKIKDVASYGKGIIVNAFELLGQYIGIGIGYLLYFITISIVFVFYYMIISVVWVIEKINNKLDNVKGD